MQVNNRIEYFLQQLSIEAYPMPPKGMPSEDTAIHFLKGLYTDPWKG